MATEVGEFRNSSEEISHWKSLALDYKERWQQIREEFEELQSSSTELEFEYDSQIKSLEKAKSELSRQLERLKSENEEVTEKFSRHRHETSRYISELEAKLSKAEETMTSQKSYIVKLETENDKLENTSRAIAASLEFLQQKLDEQTEMVAYLTFEKEDLAVEVERYKEDLKDLQNDTAVRAMVSTDVSESADKPGTPSVPGTPTRAETPQVFEAPNTPLNATRLSDKIPSTPLTPQACITAIGIVNDLMKRFGSIESKLASIRNCNKSSSLIRQRGDHQHPPPPVGENCNGVGHGGTKPVGSSSRRWSNFFRFSFLSGEADAGKEDDPSASSSTERETCML